MRQTLALLAFACAGISQAQPPAQAEFEVATVKRSPPAAGDLIHINLGAVQNGVVTLSNATLSECLQFAYGLVSEEQVSGPDWIKSRAVRFDIVAKSAEGTAGESLRTMMQTLLAERLKVTLHHEPKTLSHLALVVAKNGPRLKPASPGGNRRAVSGRISSTEMDMPRLANLLSRFERQIIVDRTGLTGTFEVQLEWSPENRTTAVPTDTTGGNTLSTAVQQQLGLKLESRKGPLDALVVERAEQVPIEN